MAKVDTLVVPDKKFIWILITEKDTKGKNICWRTGKQNEEKLKLLNCNGKQTLNDLVTTKNTFKTTRYCTKQTIFWQFIQKTVGKVIIGLEEIEFQMLL
jgi:hypothetical protein